MAASVKYAWKKEEAGFEYVTVNTGCSYRTVEVYYDGRYVGELFVGESGVYNLLIWGKSLLRIRGRLSLTNQLNSMFKAPGN
jgi:hypothetical protein